MLPKASFHLSPKQTTSLIYSHLIQTIATLRRHMYLIKQLQYLLRDSRIVRYNSGIGGQSKKSYFAQDNFGIVPILTLRRTYIMLYCLLMFTGGYKVYWNSLKNPNRLLIESIMASLLCTEPFVITLPSSGYDLKYEKKKKKKKHDQYYFKLNPQGLPFVQMSVVGWALPFLRHG